MYEHGNYYLVYLQNVLRHDSQSKKANTIPLISFSY